MMVLSSAPVVSAAGEAAGVVSRSHYISIGAGHQLPQVWVYPGRRAGWRGA